MFVWLALARNVETIRIKTRDRSASRVMGLVESPHGNLNQKIYKRNYNIVRDRKRVLEHLQAHGAKAFFGNLRCLALCSTTSSRRSNRSSSRTNLESQGHADNEALTSLVSCSSQLVSYGFPEPIICTKKTTSVSAVLRSSSVFRIVSTRSTTSYRRLSLISQTRGK